MRLLGDIRQQYDANLLFPDKVSGQADDRYQEQDEIEHGIGPQTRYDSLVLCRETNRRRDDGVQGKEEHREDERTRNRWSAQRRLVQTQDARGLHWRFGNLPATVYFVHKLNGVPVNKSA